MISQNGAGGGWHQWNFLSSSLFGQTDLLAAMLLLTLLYLLTWPSTARKRKDILIKLKVLDSILKVNSNVLCFVNYIKGKGCQDE